MEQKESSVCDSNQRINISGKSYEEQLLKRSQNVNFDIENWYKIIQNETFPTEFIPISPSIAQAFVNFYQTRYMSIKSLNSTDIQLIQSIENQLKEKINQFQNTETFIRLSARSPKDGLPLDSQKIKQFYNEKLHQLQNEYPDEFTTIKGKANIQIIAYYYAQFHSLKVKNENQALNLILSSERAFYDLLEVLDCEQVKDTNPGVYDWNNHIIIRQWNSSLDPSMEFRCFVYQSNPTAISQYNDHYKNYHFQNDEFVQQIKTTIRNYWKGKLQPLLNPFPEQYSSYVIDIGLIPNKSTDQYDCVVIEMNPFEKTTNPSLFHWITDNHILTGAGNDVEIRVQTDYYPYMEDYIEAILDGGRCNEEENSLDDNPRRKPYFIFLDQMKTEFSQQANV